MNDLSLLYRLDYLAVISVTGNDSAAFLQGQLSCNIHELNPQRAGIAAYCTAKGRVISPLLVIPDNKGYRLLLPSELQATVLKRLQMYVLRSKVTLKLEPVAPLGIQTTLDMFADLALPNTAFAVNQNDSLCCVRLPSKLPRYYWLNTESESPPACPLATQDKWRFEDIADGLPWFAAAQSEAYTPHMLGLDRLGGISLNKGCYTGQEIIARTHYLGKNKRTLLAATTTSEIPVKADQAIIDSRTQHVIGHVLIAQTCAAQTRLLMVVTIDPEDIGPLCLDDASATPLTLLPFQGVYA